ncbi:MAG: efflux RND transporter periplasmic adaptor subunit [Planctomycetia bacterium]|nr:efflux RND transporter periplasmic adaptor subunit [Planctomycetia bacterium]
MKHRLASWRLHPRFPLAAWSAGGVLLTAAVTWLWAHEGHAPLPTRGAQVDVEKGIVVLSREARDALDVQTAFVEMQAIEERVPAYALLTAPWRKDAFATSPLPGRLSKIHVQPGQLVSAGQVLAEVESLELKSLQLELINAENQVQLSTKILKELEQASGAVSGLRLLEAQAKQRQDRNALEIARNKWLNLGLAEADLKQLLQDRNPQAVVRLPVRSPIAGVITHGDAVVGQVVDPAEHLMEIVDLSTVWVQIGVLEQNLHQVAVGQSVELRLAAYPRETIRTRVDVKGLWLNPQTHVGVAWAELSNPSESEPRFLPGMHGLAQLVLAAPKKTTVIPEAALMRDGIDRFVLVEGAQTNAGSEYRKQNVVVGRQVGGLVEVRGGNLYPGDRVVTRGAYELAGFFIQGVLRPSPEAAKSIGLRVEPVQPTVVEDVLTVDGAVESPPDRRTFVSAQLPGVLQAIHIERGQTVRAGDIVGELASLELQDLQLDLLRAHLDAEVQAETLKRLQMAGEAVPRRQLWETESAHNAAVNRRENLKQRLQAVGLSAQQLGDVLTKKQPVATLPLRAPIDGAIVHFDKALGQAVKAQEPLFEIHDLSRVWVQGWLSEPEVPRVRIGQSVRVRLTADPGFLAEGTVLRSGRVVGVENRTLAVWVELKQPPTQPLQHNMLARLSLVLGQPPAVLAVPLGAVVWEGARAFVFIRKTDGSFERRAITTGRADDRSIEVKQGLQAGEMVAVQGTAELQTAYAGIR